MTPSIRYMRPMFIELAAMFAAGYVVGKYTQANMPTIAEVRAIAEEAAAKGQPVPDLELMTNKKPYISYNDGVLSLNLAKRGRK